MPVIIPDNIRKSVIQEWLAGKNRPEIHSIYDISEGSVSNIVEEWRNDLGAYTADSLRELAVALRKIKLTPERCAIGFRVSRLMQKIGVWEEDFDYFNDKGWIVTDNFRQWLTEDGLHSSVVSNPDLTYEYLVEYFLFSKLKYKCEVYNHIRN